MRKKFLLYGHGGSYNHGSEAIVRTTIELLRRQYENCEIALVTHFRKQDEEFGLPVDVYYERNQMYVDMQRALGDVSQYNDEIYENALLYIDENTVCLSVGGDNYCYDGWRRWRPFLNRCRSVGAVHVLWGCSVNPKDLDGDMLSDFKLFNKIIVRESCSGNGLQKVLKDNVVLGADTAFMLEKKACCLPEGWNPNGMVALNISPLILKTVDSPGQLWKEIEDVISYICENTTWGIALIPHVMMPMDNDYELLKDIWEKMQHKERMVLVSEQLSAAEYKYLISKCQIGIFARTHATIAAYSEVVPCIALGYSVKAQGLARDMGMEAYVATEQIWEDSGKLKEMTEKLIVNEKMIRFELQENVRVIRERVSLACRELEKTVNLGGKRADADE